MMNEFCWTSRPWISNAVNHPGERFGDTLSQILPKRAILCLVCAIGFVRARSAPSGDRFSPRRRSQALARRRSSAVDQLTGNQQVGGSHPSVDFIDSQVITPILASRAKLVIASCLPLLRWKGGLGMRLWSGRTKSWRASRSNASPRVSPHGPESKRRPICYCWESEPGILGDPHLGPVCSGCYAMLTATCVLLDKIGPRVGIRACSSEIKHGTLRVIAHAGKKHAIVQFPPVRSRRWTRIFKLLWNFASSFP